MLPIGPYVCPRIQRTLLTCWRRSLACVLRDRRVHPRAGNQHIKDKLLRLAEDGSKKMQNTMRDAIVELEKVFH
jgi:hypothetical protein